MESVVTPSINIKERCEMFDTKEFVNVDREYFEVINETCYHLTLKSCNTGHTWDIECRNNPNNTRSLVISHKHKDSDPFHIQLICNDLLSRENLQGVTTNLFNCY